MSFSFGSFFNTAKTVAGFVPGVGQPIANALNLAENFVTDHPAGAAAIGAGAATAGAVGAALIVHQHNKNKRFAARVPNPTRRRFRSSRRRVPAAVRYLPRVARHRRRTRKASRGHSRMPAALRRYWATHSRKGLHRRKRAA